MSVFTANASAEMGEYGDANESIKDNLTDLITPAFDVEYAVAFNNFEGVQYFSGDIFSLRDTDDPEYSKAFSVSSNGNWAAFLPDNNLKYSWYGREFVMFNEPLVSGKNYILSYDYITKTPQSDEEGFSFSLAPQHENFKNDGGDYFENIRFYGQNVWQRATFGFTADKENLSLKINTAGHSAESFVDNMLIMEAATIDVLDDSGTTKIVELSSNVLTGSNAKNGLTLVAKGEAVSFKVKTLKGMKVKAVKHGESVIEPDAEGFYNISKVTDDISVETVLTASLATEYYISDDNCIYIDYNSNVNRVSDLLSVDSAFIKGFRDDDILVSEDIIIKAGDKLTLSTDNSADSSYRVKIKGDGNNDDQLSVCDIIFLVDYILNKTVDSHTTNVMDMNGSCKTTVSDVVLIRKEILSVFDNIMDKNVSLAMEEFNQNVMNNSGTDMSYNRVNNGIYNIGSRALIADVMRRAMKGEDITIACIGGSITEGTGSDQLPTANSGIVPNYDFNNNNYVDWIGKWWSRHFEEYGGKLTLVNAGISATDTVLGIHRLEEDVLSKNPDIVIVEYAVNDGMDVPYKQASYEAIIRTLMEKKIATIMLEMCVSIGHSSQELHEPISSLYHVPMVSFRDAYSSYDKFSNLYPDGTHPNAVGHPLAALLVNNILASAYSQLDDIGSYIPAIPENCVNKETVNYMGAHIVNLSDVLSGGVDSVKVVDIGSFYIEEEKTAFAYKEYYGVTADYSENYQPLVLEISDCKSLFIQMLRSNKIADGKYKVEINGEMISDDTFTCSSVKSVDNAQPELIYHWSSANIYRSSNNEKIVMKIYPDNTDPTSKVTLYSLLLS